MCGTVACKLALENLFAACVDLDRKEGRDADEGGRRDRGGGEARPGGRQERNYASNLEWRVEGTQRANVCVL